MKLKKPKFWDYKKPNIIAYLLYPFSKIIDLILNLKSKAIRINPKIKTICIGNIYVGGTGKTSLAIKIKKILEQHDKRVCFIKKYYSDQIDEQKILENNGKLFTSKRRVDALDNAISDGYELAIFDDGLQDTSIKYDLQIVCFNTINWVGNGFTIPAGPLRENINKFKFYNNIFLIGNDENLIDIKEQLKKINPQVDINIGKYIPKENHNLDKDRKYLVFSGIGNHGTFLNMLKKNNFKIIDNIEFPDHYRYSANDLEKINTLAQKNNAGIITTEKDYLRIDNFKKDKIEFIRSDLEISDEEKLKKTLVNLDEKN